MKFSAQEEYGLRCLIAIARSPEGSFATIPAIAKAEELSEPHVAKLLMILRKAGFVKSTRGHTGGYALAKDPREIPVADVLDVLGGKFYAEGFCSRHSGLAPSCVHETECAVQFIWDEVQSAVDGVLNRITLADVLNREPEPVPSTRVSVQLAPPAGLAGRRGA
jgi:Rrf2 family protein